MYSDDLNDMAAAWTGGILRVIRTGEDVHQTSQNGDKNHTTVGIRWWSPTHCPLT
jgi:hypothetical protein